MRKVRENSPLRNWDTYWQKKWEEEKRMENEKKVLTTNNFYGIIKTR